MKLTKQQVQAIVLGVLLVGLSVAAYVQFRGMSQTSKAASSKPAATGQGKSAAKDATPELAKQNDAPMSWVLDDAQLAARIGQAASLRNPFSVLVPLPTGDEGAPASSTPSTPPSTPAPTQINDRPIGLPLPGPVPTPVSPVFPLTEYRSVPYSWVTLAELQADLAEQCPAVQAHADAKQPGAVVLSGPAAEVARAEARVIALSTPPPVPPFTLAGVAITRQRSLAYISLNGTTYTLTQGQAIPHEGWSIAAITPNRVTLTDGRGRIVDLQLSGGIK